MTNTQRTYWTPFIDDQGAVQGHECAVQRDGFTVTGTWTEQDGYRAYIDHDADGPFTMTELHDLFITLGELMRDTEMSDIAPVGKTVNISMIDTLSNHNITSTREDE
ncbi:MAG: hypothetical protein HLX51_06460 [Micrococcaceae bacterium]|nr:hypothetical protein [Micrococcaceae bacterium]